MPRVSPSHHARRQLKHIGCYELNKVKPFMLHVSDHLVDLHGQYARSALLRAAADAAE